MTFREEFRRVRLAAIEQPKLNPEPLRMSQCDWGRVFEAPSGWNVFARHVGGGRRRPTPATLPQAQEIFSSR